MRNFQKVNQFFTQYVYQPSIDFGLYPISWAFTHKMNDQPSYIRKALLVALSPLFFELTAITGSLALSVITSALFIHAIAAVTAGLIDILPDFQNNLDFGAI